MKTKLIALAALVLGVASCQNDFDGGRTNAGGEVNFSLGIAAPELNHTRAGVDGVADTQNAWDSAFGAIDYLQAIDDADDYRVDWEEVDLRYSLEVYDVENGEVKNTTPIKDRMVKIVDTYEPVMFDLRLAPNREYRFVVFADFVDQGASDVVTNTVQGELGIHHSIGATLQNITVKADGINKECTDAYFAKRDIRIENSAAQNIVLQRPYGKIRVITTDLAELNLNVDPARVVVTYDAHHPVAFNAVTGKIDTEVKAEALTFESEYNKGVCKESLANHFYTAGYDDYALYGTVNANGEKRHTHMTLFTDYILATEEHSPIHFKMSVYDGVNAEPIKTTEFDTEIPVQRNHLTTIIGNVLTTGTQINVTIDDNFANEYVVNYASADTLEELQKAIDSAKAGQENVIYINNDIVGNVMITEIPATTIVINGQNHKYDGCMQINGKTEYKNATTVFSNINFETADKSNFLSDAFIYCGEAKGTAYRYPDNVTIENCTFTATGAAVENAVGAKFWSLNGNLVVKDCEAQYMHSLMQLTSCGEAIVTVDNTTIANCKNGISLQYAGNTVIKNSNIASREYGVRADGCTATTTFENTTIEAKQPVIVRKMKSDNNYVLNFATTSLKAADYQVIFTTGSDDAEYAAPAMGTYTLNCEDANYRVFPVVEDYTIEAYNANDLLRWAWLANNSEETYNVVFMNDITLPQNVIAEGEGCYYYTTEEITVTNGIPSGSNWKPVGTLSNKYTDALVDGNGKILTGLAINSNTRISGFIGYSENIVVKDLTFYQATLYSTNEYCSPIAYVDDGSYIYNVHTTNSTITGTGYVAGIVSMLMDHFDHKGLCKRIEADPSIKRVMPITTMEKCTVDATTVITGTTQFAGGICGKAYGVLIYDCHNQADVTGKDCVGGVSGYMRDYQQNEHGLIINCSSTNSTIVGKTNYGAICGMLEHDNNHTGALTAVVGCYTNSVVANNKIVDKFARGQEKVYGNYAAGTTADVDDLNAEIKEYNDFIEKYNVDFYSKYFEQCVYSDYEIPSSKYWAAADLQ